MADFPSAIYAPRTIENRPGVVYDANDTKTFFAEDHEQVTGEIVAIENALGANLANLALNGWLPLATIPTLQASDNPVYTLRFGADMTAIIGLGNRIKLTQNGSVKYFIVVKVGAYTGGNTDIDVYGGSDYDMENTGTYPVTVPYYSIAKAPFGFPLNPLKWTEIYDMTTNDNHATPAQNTWYNPGSRSFAFPIGVWRIKLRYSLMGNNAGGTPVEMNGSLSTSNNSESDADFTTNSYISFSSNYGGYFIPTIFTEKVLALTTKTTYYLIARTTQASQDYVGFRGDMSKTLVRAECAYL